MKRSTVIKAAILLIAGNTITELWGWLPEKWTDQQIDIFLKPEFHLQVSVAWYLKELCDDFNTIIIFFVMGMLVRPFSHSMFAVVTIFAIYHIIDAFMLIWDFKQTREIYWVSVMMSMIAVTFLLKDNNSKVVKMNNSIKKIL